MSQTEIVMIVCAVLCSLTYIVTNIFHVRKGIVITDRNYRIFEKEIETKDKTIEMYNDIILKKMDFYVYVMTPTGLHYLTKEMWEKVKHIVDKKD